jgi:hypothetical protein
MTGEMHMSPKTTKTISFTFTLALSALVGCGGADGEAGGGGATGCHLEITGPGVAVDEVCAGDWQAFSMLNGTAQYAHDDELSISFSPINFTMLPVTITAAIETDKRNVTYTPVDGPKDAAGHSLFWRNTLDDYTFEVTGYYADPKTLGYLNQPHGQLRATLAPFVKDDADKTVAVDVSSAVTIHMTF